MSPPLDADFFVRVEALAEKRATVRQALNRFQRALRAVGTFADPWRPVPSSLEQFFADVYYEVARTRGGEPFEVFISLLDLYARTLEETTNWMGARRRTGPVGKLLRLEMERAAGDVLTIVTFNHDLVLENEVRRLPRTTHRWCLSSLYSDIDLQPIESGVANALPHDDDDCMHDLPLVVLKLHGSLNWILRTRSPDPELGTLFPAPAARQRQVFVHDSWAPRHYGARVRGDGRPWYAWPLIVPPIYDKQRVTGTDLFEEVWEQAYDAIERTERLTLVGYSLPDADVFARQMLRRAFAQNAALDQIDVVNPDAAVMVKLRAILAPSVVRSYDDIDSYLEHSQP